MIIPRPISESAAVKLGEILVEAEFARLLANRDIREFLRVRMNKLRLVGKARKVVEELVTMDKEESEKYLEFFVTATLENRCAKPSN